METTTKIVESLYERVEAYFKSTLELTKLKVLYSITQIITTLISRLSVLLMVTMFAFFANIGISLWLGEILGKYYYGFFIVASFYLILAMLLHFYLHKWIKRPVSKLIFSKALDYNDENNF